MKVRGAGTDVTISNHINRSSTAFQVLSPMLEGFTNCQEFFVVSVVVEFSRVEGAGVKSDGMDFSIRSEN